MGNADQEALAKLIEEAKESGGSELANYQLFVERLSRALDVPQPAMAREENRLNDYTFERGVTFHHPNGSTSTGRIDCYKRDCFILEAKQSAKRQKARSTEQLELAGMEASQKLGHAKRGTKTWDKVMVAAKMQAEDYARALPDDHDYPPFILVVDVGNVIEVFADFSGQGRNYAHFPDRQSYRLSMDDLLDANVQDRLRAIWTDPHSLDPAKISAVVTEDIAKRLAKIAKSLERHHDPKDIAEFLMRCLFTMFAEDIGLIEETEEEKREGIGPFEAMLGRMVETPDYFPAALESLWRSMDEGGYAGEFGRPLKRFNGSLFKNCTALKLEADDIRELWLASRKDWEDVEPAIFGTLLERALDPKERGKLGAHFTPRVYVERLVIPTIIEPLREDWQEVQALVGDLHKQGKDDAARKAVRDFHHRLATTRVLDPACGTGNFLYVSLELMKRLEGEVLETLEALDEDEARLLLDGETVSPRQFYGLEINPRAVPIADLVLWIGFLKWQLRTVDAKNLPEPILHAYGTIREQDAILAYESKTLRKDAQGELLTIWDGTTHKRHPITDKLVPDLDSQVQTYSYSKATKAKWPDSDFIVGNPPFIGNKLLRRRLGDGYVDALFSAYADIPNNIDFVMYWWAKSAALLNSGKIRAFGWVTTNSIKQVSNRQIIAQWLENRDKKYLGFAVPDHPWVDSAKAAQVRIAMTVATKNSKIGRLVSFAKGKLSEPKIGEINPDLTIGVNITKCCSLIANERISFQGCKLGHEAFQVQSAAFLPNSEREVIRAYYGGDELKFQNVPSLVIDANSMTRNDLQIRFPTLFSYLLERIKPHRDQVRRDSTRENWWRYGESRPEMRDALKDLSYYIATPESADQRIFTRLAWPDILLDGSAIALALDSFMALAVVSSRIHVIYSFRAGGRQGKGNSPRYQNTLTFDPFPFPILTSVQSASLDELGERLDSFRKRRLAERNFLTMTDMYNVLERLRELEAGADVPALSDKEKAIHDAGLISVLKDIHNEIDREVFAAYGWSDIGERLVGRPGATTPSPHKTEDQEAAEEDLLSRLVALNQERAAEEKRGLVRWLRPDYQKPRLAHKVSEELDITADQVEAGDIEKRSWPSDGLEQIRILRDMLAEAEAPLPVEMLATLFKGRTTSKRKARVAEVLDTLVATGAAREGEDGYFVPR